MRNVSKRSCEARDLYADVLSLSSSNRIAGLRTPKAQGSSIEMWILLSFPVSVIKLCLFEAQILKVVICGATMEGS